MRVNRPTRLCTLAHMIVYALGVAIPATLADNIIRTDSTDNSSELAFPCRNTDLVNNGQSTLAAVSNVGYTAFGGSSTAKLNDGDLGVASDTATVAFDLDGIWETTFYLNTSVNTNGYTITNVTTIAGWPPSRASQAYDVSFSFQGDPASGFVSQGMFTLATVIKSSRISLTGAAAGGVIASNVNAVRITFSSPGSGAETCYREIDVGGTASTHPLNVTLPVVTGGTGPGGFGSGGGTINLRAWFRADGQPYANGATVTNWPDLAGNGYYVRPGSGAGNDPAMVLNVLNGRPVVRFDGNDWFRRTGISPTVRDAFVVARCDVATLPEYLGLCGDDPESVNVYVVNGVQSSSKLAQGVGAFTTARRNGSVKSFSSGHDFAPLTNAWIGVFRLTLMTSLSALGVGAINNTPARAWQGDIAELALYNAGLNEAQHILIENYASAAYGLALAAGVDHYSGDDAGQGRYDRDVFGIGRVNGSNRHLSSGSAGFGIQAPGLEDGEWLLAGHRVRTNAVEGLTWKRSWYVDSTGLESNESATLVFDWSDAGLGAPLAGFRSLMYRSATNSTFRSVARGTVAGDRVTFTLTTALLPDGYYTLGPVSAGALFALY